MEDRTYTQKEVQELAVALKERQETLEALECARIVMAETRQYPRFIVRLDHLIKSIEGVTQEEVVEPVETKPEEKKPETVQIKNKQK